MMEKPVIRISVRNLVEFILRNGDLESACTEKSRSRWEATIRPKFH